MKNDLLAPEPEMTAEQFVGAIAAHNYASAIDQLSEEQQHIKAQDLQMLVEVIDATRQGIVEAHGEATQQQETTASAITTVKLGNGQQSLEFSLIQEHSLWKLVGIDPIRHLAGE